MFYFALKDRLVILAEIFRRRAEAIVQKAIPRLEDWIGSVVVADRNQNYDLNLTRPYLLPIIFSAQKSGIRQITIMGGAQISKTEFVFALTCWHILHKPGNVLMLYPDLATAMKYAERLRRNLKSTPELKKIFENGRSRIGNTGIVLWFKTGKRIIIAWSGSKMAAAGDPVPLVIVDEIDKAKDAGLTGSHVENLSRRMATYPDALMVCACTPDGYGNTISSLYARSLQHTFAIRCPECGAYQIPRFENYRWPRRQCQKCDNLEWWSPESPSRTDLPCPACKAPKEDVTVFHDMRHQDYMAHIKKFTIYKCEQCQRDITEDERWDAVKAGKFISGEWNDEFNRFKLDAEENQDRIRAHMGYHVPAFITWFRSFGAIAADWMNAKTMPDKQACHQNDAALPYIPSRIVATESRLKRLEDTQLPFPSDQNVLIPADTIGIIVGLDVQETSVYAAPVAFRPDFKKHVCGCWHFHGYSSESDPTEGTYGIALNHAAEFIWKKMNFVRRRAAGSDGSNGQRPVPFESMKPYAVIDVKDGDVQQGCFAWIRNQGGMAAPWMGLSSKQMDQTQEGREKYLDHAGMAVIQGWSHLERRRILEEFMAEPGQAGSWTFAVGMPAEFYSHLTAWQWSPRKSATLDLVQRRMDDHYLDCLIIAYVSARLKLYQDGAPIYQPRPVEGQQGETERRKMLERVQDEMRARKAKRII